MIAVLYAYVVINHHKYFVARNPIFSAEHPLNYFKKKKKSLNPSAEVYLQSGAAFMGVPAYFFYLFFFN